MTYLVKFGLLGVLAAAPQDPAVFAVDLAKMDLATLHRTANSPAVKRDVEKLSLAFREIGRRGDPSSVKVLATNPMTPLSYPVIRARIYGLANIRSPESVQAMRDMLVVASQTNIEVAIFIEDFRTALHVLTGADEGPSRAFWERWWTDNRRTFSMSDKRPWLPERQALRWKGFWGTDYLAQLPAPPKPESNATSVADAVQKLGATEAAERLGAADYLARSGDAAALQALHQAAGNPRLQRDEELFASVLRAIARRGDPSSVSVLANKPFSVRDYDAIRTRIWGLARIRTPESINALVQLSQVASPLRGDAFTFIHDFQTALVVLTGIDKGPGKQTWFQWWRGAKNGYRVPKQRPWMSQLHELRWEEFWGEEYVGGQRPVTPGVPSMTVAAAIAALSKSDGDSIAAAAALSHAPDAASLRALHRAANNGNVQKNPPLLTAVLKAIGRRGDPSSIPVLIDNPLSVRDFDVIRARIYGLANIRTNAALDALVAAIKKASPPPGEAFAFIEDIRTVGCVLSGEDHGPWKFGWDQWWRGVSKSFTVPAQRPKITPLMAVRWEDFWGEKYGG
jgi:hypothetical protein